MQQQDGRLISMAAAILCSHHMPRCVMETALWLLPSSSAITCLCYWHQTINHAVYQSLHQKTTNMGESARGHRSVHITSAKQPPVRGIAVVQECPHWSGPRSDSGRLAACQKHTDEGRHLQLQDSCISLGFRQWLCTDASGSKICCQSTGTAVLWTVWSYQQD